MKFPMHKRNGRKSILVAEMLEKLENRILIIADNAERLHPKITSLPTDSKRVLTGIFSSITCNVLVLKDNTECVSTTQNIRCRAAYSCLHAYFFFADFVIGNYNMANGQKFFI